MRMPTAPLAVIGVALILLGGFLLFGGGLTTHRDVLAIGSVKVSAEEKRTVSPWIATATILGGIALLTTLRRKS